MSKRDRGEVKLTIRYDGTRAESVSTTQPNLNSSMESVVDAIGRTTSTIENTGPTTYSTTTSWNNRTGTENASWRSAPATLILDGYGRNVQQTIIGVVSQNIVDVDGGTVLRKSPNLHPQTYTYNSNQVATIDWGGRTTTMDYDAAGRMIDQVDPLNHRITNEYDELNIIRSSVISAEVEETHTFDTGGYLSNRDTDNGNHVYTHGPGGELLSVATPTGTYGYTYEKDGLLSSLSPPGGALQRFTYDSNRRLASRSRGTSKWITTHSGAQATTQSQLGLTTTTLTDARGRPVSETFGGATGLQQRSTTYTVDDQPLTISDDVVTTFTYDALLRVTGKTRPGTSPRSYSYNDNSISLGVAQANGAYAYNGFGELTQAGPVSLSYSANGLLTGKTGETRSYTSSSLLSGITTNTADISYTYDGNGNRLTETINGVTKTYTYDNSDRLLSMTSPTRTESYIVRGDGARTSATINGVTITYSYDSSDGLQGNGYTTDADGRVTLRNSVPLVWDAANRLLSIGTSTNSYDGQNQRLSAPGHDWTWGMGMEAVDGDVVISGMNTVLAKGTEVYSHDAIGSIMNGAAYGPFGDSATIGIGYTGHWNDDTGLVYAQQRWLDPVTGRFLSEDPVAGDVMQPMSTQGFIYANGNPMRYVDPDGRLAFLALVPIIKALAVATVAGGVVGGGIGVARSVAVDGELPSGLDAMQSVETGAAFGAGIAGAAIIAPGAAVAGTIGGAAVGVIAAAANATVLFEAYRSGIDVEGSMIREVIFDGATAGIGAKFAKTGGTRLAQFGRDTQAAVAAAVARSTAPRQLAGATMAAADEAGAAGGACRGPNCGGTVCFVAGISVKGADGDIPIESVEIGDEVWSRDEVTDETKLNRVTRTFVTEGQATLRVVFEDETVESTYEHPYFVVGAGFRAASELRAGDEIASFSGDARAVVSVEAGQSSVTVYNFEVEGTHTYFVGDDGLWVHNTCEWQDLPLGVQISRQGDFWVKRVNPAASRPMRWLGKRSISQQHDGLMRLGDMATEHTMRDGMLYTRHVGQLMSEVGGVRNPLFWKVWRVGSQRMGTIVNDIRPRNMGANGLIFDPSLDPLIVYGMTAAAVGAGAGGAIGLSQ